jgi:tRNA (guanine37-N1)-methyltransferase
MKETRAVLVFDIITIFPEFFRGPFEHGIIRRGREKALIETRIHDLRQFTTDRHRTVDDRPFGGGEGMVLKPEPIFTAVERVREGTEAEVVVLSAAGPGASSISPRRFGCPDRIR